MLVLRNYYALMVGSMANRSTRGERHVHKNDGVICCYIVVTLLSLCCYIALTLLLRCTYIAVTLLLHCGYTVLTLFLHCRYTVIILLGL
jgi:hypothetical protein